MPCRRANGRCLRRRSGSPGADRVSPFPGRDTLPSVGRISTRERRAARAERAFASLPDRYLGAAPGFRARVEVRLSDLGRSWEVRLGPRRCRVITPACDNAQVVIATDSSTWLALREGRLSGLDAFASRRLEARGDLDLAMAFEGMFRLPGGRSPLLRVHRVATAAAELSAITSGAGGEHVICIHGLGATKASFFSTIAALAPDHCVHALDLPGFGSSEKPARAPFDSAYFAAAVRDFMDRMEIGRAHLVGNSMGGRVAIELGLNSPERVLSLGLLAPALAFLRRGRGLVPLVRLLRPELAALPHTLTDSRVRKQFLSLFAQPERLDPALADVACDEFMRIYASGAARVAFYSAARNIYLDRPHGDDGLWTRLGSLEAPATFVWGTHDTLIPAAFSRHVERALPAAEQVILDQCGHVPQVECPERTNALLAAAIERASPARRPAARRRRPGTLRERARLTRRAA